MSDEPFLRAWSVLSRSFVTVTRPPERVVQFEWVFGKATVPVKELLPIPTLWNLPGFDEPQLAYTLDADAITPAERERLIQIGVDSFDMTREECEHELNTFGLPILAADCIFSTDTMEFL